MIDVDDDEDEDDDNCADDDDNGVDANPLGHLYGNLRFSDVFSMVFWSNPYHLHIYTELFVIRSLSAIYFWRELLLPNLFIARSIFTDIL